MRIWNADGGAVEQCGNAARCVGWLLMEATGRDSARLDTPAGLVTVERAGPKAVTVDMGKPGLDWRDIPLEEAMDTRGIELQVGPIDAPLFHTPGAVSMGNPHVVFFVKDAEVAPVREVGSMIEYHRLFPQRTNVEFCEVKARDRLRVRVWERGVGVTKACGTGACAALVAASRRNLCGRQATVEMDGGDLLIEWRREDDHVLMTGPIEVEFTNAKLPEALPRHDPPRHPARPRRGDHRRRQRHRSGRRQEVRRFRHEPGAGRSARGRARGGREGDRRQRRTVPRTCAGHEAGRRRRQSRRHPGTARKNAAARSSGRCRDPDEQRRRRRRRQRAIERPDDWLPCAGDEPVRRDHSGCQVFGQRR